MKGDQEGLMSMLRVLACFHPLPSCLGKEWGGESPGQSLEWEGASPTDQLCDLGQAAPHLWTSGSWPG